MKKNIIQQLRLTVAFIILIPIGYTLLILGFAKLTPSKGEGIFESQNGILYSPLVGQRFNSDTYFWSRPSATDYNAAGSAGSNQGPTNPSYLVTVNARIDSFSKHNPSINKSEIPADLVTASGSGIDPHISIKAARIQVCRIARARNLEEGTINTLIDQIKEKPWLDLFGPEKINVVELNLKLDQLKSK